MLPGIVNAQNVQEAPSFFQQYQMEIIVTLALIVSLIALIVVIISLYAVVTILEVPIPLFKPKEKKEDLKAVTKESYWRRLITKMNEAVPVSQEQKVMTDHEYDGIRELDNKLPSWWLYLFYLTIIFGVGYMLHYHVLGTGELQAEEYETEMAEAKMKVEAYLASLDEIIDESNVTMLEDENDLVTGEELFVLNCTPCHGQEGGGNNIGPNLTDQYWIHGGSIKDIFSVIKYGVPSKGMIPWKSQLTPKQMQQLSSFVVTLQGTDPPNAKEPEGELYVRDEPDNQEAREEVVEDAVEN